MKYAFTQLFSEPLLQRIIPHIFPGTEEGQPCTISLQGIDLLAQEQRVSPRAAMVWCLERDIWPARFVRNHGVLNACEQKKLLESKVAFIGCGALGGYASVLLARLGVGTMVLCDPDIFEESNLNRQFFCTEDVLKQPKAQVASACIKQIASHVETTVKIVAAANSTLPDILQGVDVVVDCLDSLVARREVEFFSLQAGIPFVYGAIAGLEGFAAVSLPGDTPLSARLYGEANDIAGAEKNCGLPAPTPAFIACLEAWLTVLLLTAPNVTALASTPRHLIHADLSTLQIELLAV